MEEKSLKYYVELPYTIELRFDEDGGYARVKELPGCEVCEVSVEASDSVEKLRQQLDSVDYF